jgi:hypothetical protein
VELFKASELVATSLVSVMVNIDAYNSVCQAETDIAVRVLL